MDHSTEERLRLSQFQLDLGMDFDNEEEEDGFMNSSGLRLSGAACPVSPLPGMRMTPRSQPIPELRLGPSTNDQSNGFVVSNGRSRSLWSTSKQFEVHPSLFSNSLPTSPPPFSLSSRVSNEEYGDQDSTMMSFDHHL